MQWSGWIYFGFTAALFVAFIVAVLYYYNPKKKTKIENPKYTMLDDDEIKGDEPGESENKRK